MDFAYSLFVHKLHDAPQGWASVWLFSLEDQND